MLSNIKLVCTIGPATWDPAIMKQLVELGMTVARVNGAFADTAELDRVKALVRQFSSSVSLMVDVKGPEIRLNKFSQPINVKPGDVVRIGSKPEHGIYPYNYPYIYKLLTKGNKIVVGDGDVLLVVDSVDKAEGLIFTKVVYGEQIKPGKALNLVGITHSEEVLTPKDRENLLHGLNTGWDMVSASFIKNKKSALKIREVIGDKMALIAKIEDRDGVANIDEILEVVDGIMVARGGLGVDLGLKYVPVVERKLIAKARSAGKPVITATQLLETMVKNPYPTRAEINDIETAVILGTDAVMLSGETAGGQHPVEATRVLAETARFAYEYVDKYIKFDTGMAPVSTIAIANAAIEIASKLKNELAGIVVVSKSGTTVRLIARGNLTQPIFAFTETTQRAKWFNVLKGVRKAFALPANREDIKRDRDKAVAFLLKALQDNGLALRGERFLIVGKTPVTKEPFFPNIFEILEIM